MKIGKLHLVILALVGSLSLSSAGAINPTSEAAARVEESARVLDEIMAAPDKGIPRDLLSKANCVAIIPSMKRGGFIFGARYGKGVVSCRGEGGKGWTGPSTVRVEGGSFGLQIGGSATDVVLLVMNERGSEELMKDEFTLGGDASVAAGPVGRSVEAGTDVLMNAKILAYSRSRGIFAGAVVGGGTLRSDDTDNWRLYGREVDHEEILQGKVGIPPVAHGLINTLSRYSAQES
jgi:SH3 domain-containing YSC84-like protein 1